MVPAVKLIKYIVYVQEGKRKNMNMTRRETEDIKMTHTKFRPKTKSEMKNIPQKRPADINTAIKLYKIREKEN